MDVSLKELKELMVPGSPTCANGGPTDLGKVIVVADRGWVFIGPAKRHTSGDVSMENADNIRIWGTTKGLGEIAQDGPTTSTKLDPIGTVLIPAAAVIAIITCRK